MLETKTKIAFVPKINFHLYCRATEAIKPCALRHIIKPIKIKSSKFVTTSYNTDSTVALFKTQAIIGES